MHRRNIWQCLSWRRAFVWQTATMLDNQFYNLQSCGGSMVAAGASNCPRAWRLVELSKEWWVDKGTRPSWLWSWWMRRRQALPPRSIISPVVSPIIPMFRIKHYSCCAAPYFSRSTMTFFTSWRYLMYDDTELLTVFLMCPLRWRKQWSVAMLLLLIHNWEQ